MRDAWLKLRARVGAMEPRRLDAALALVVFVVVELELALLPLGDDRLRAHALGLVTLAGLLVRRRAPELCLVLVFAAAIGFQRIPAVYEDGASMFFVGFLATYTLGAHLEGRRLALGVAIALVMIFALLASDPQAGISLGDVFFGLVILLGGPVLIGSILRSRAAIARALSEKATRAEAERTRQADRAVEEERARIAGELHDVVAHALSAMVVQASAARRLVATNGPAATGAFGAIEHSGREALTEIRSLLGVLRREDEEIALSPQPSLAHAGSLVRRMGMAGLPVALTVEGDARPLPAGVDLAAFRVLQEALGEALDPGGAGSATVRIVYGPSDVELEVRDDGRASGERSLLGMRERVALYGGDLRALRAGGGSGAHVVRARMPAGGAA
jgi:signal transduction histidine kinase